MIVIFSLSHFGLKVCLPSMWMVYGWWVLALQGRVGRIGTTAGLSFAPNHPNIGDKPGPALRSRLRAISSVRSDVRFKRLKLVGFKSFVDPTELRIDGGRTA